MDLLASKPNFKISDGVFNKNLVR